MSTIIITATARADQEDNLHALAARWPQFSASELRRLRVLVYRHDMGWLRPPAPVRAVVERLCEEIAAYLRTPPPLLAPTPRLQYAAAMGVPPLWRVWAAAHAPTPPPAPC